MDTLLTSFGELDVYQWILTVTDSSLAMNSSTNTVAIWSVCNTEAIMKIDSRDIVSRLIRYLGMDNCVHILKRKGTEG